MTTPVRHDVSTMGGSNQKQGFIVKLLGRNFAACLALPTEVLHFLPCSTLWNTKKNHPVSHSK
jgi:hypothetical protein